MSIGEIGPDLTFTHFNQITKTKDFFARQQISGQKINSPAEDSSGLAGVNQDQASFNKHTAINTDLQLAAKSIRAADQVMEKIEIYIDRMKAQLDRIVKNYPPFPPGSEERISLLKSFTALRRQIDQLTIPPAEQGILKITGDPSFVSDLNIPRLSESAPDSEIYAALENLGIAKETLAGKRAGLVADASSIARSQIGNAFFAEESLSPEEDPEIKSAELKRGLITESIKSLTENQAPLMQLLE
ncbi:MAG: hypothetical protein FJ117_00720 [Deltaproteobacteria bacterium]|nr:hypothetical protein [Deltaproteobacteria bacterium]